MTTQQTERQVINLIAADRLAMPINSLGGKLDRMKPKLAQAVEMPGTNFHGERVYARVEAVNKEKARTLREGIDAFKEAHPQYGAILEGMIAQTRERKEVHLYFGVNEGSRLSAQDYMEVMSNLGFNERNAIELYPVLMDNSRKLARARDEERSVIIG